MFYIILAAIVLPCVFLLNRMLKHSSVHAFIINHIVENITNTGYPVGIGGELYGGSMFIKSAATDTCQGKAIQSINEKWGQGMTGNGRPWGGRETIGIQVCKKKFSPFVFTVDTIADDENIAKNSNASASSATGNRKRKIVKVVRMFGCPHHSDLRKEKIECYGVRKGWEPFG